MRSHTKFHLPRSNGLDVNPEVTESQTGTLLLNYIFRYNIYKLFIEIEFSGLEELGQVAADVTSCQIMDKTIICLHFATFFVLHVNKNFICPTD